ncbi:MAG: hypothetical protein ACJ799_04150 [Gemmatimonadaceae bacterium]
MAEAGDQIINQMETSSAVVDRGTMVSGSTISRELLGDALRVALEDAAARSVESMLALKIAVELFTADLRDGGMMPEAVIIALKKILRSRTDGAGILMREQVTTWCIEEFYANTKA